MAWEYEMSKSYYVACRLLLLPVAIAGLLLSCDLNAPGSPPPVPPAEEAVFSGLPAWETEWEKSSPSGKADKYDDYRQQHPELYGVTAPPSGPVRPLSEYGPSRAVLMRPSGSISKFHKGIIKGLEDHVERLVIFHTGAQNVQMKGQIESWGVNTGFIEFLDVEETDSIWTRDYGPVSHVSEDGKVGFVDFRYYKKRMHDDAIPTRLANHWDINVFRISMSFEGGNFMSDPHGTCYATEKIYKQNGGYPKNQIDAWMEEYLGCTQMVIAKLPAGLGTGHIDMFSKLMSDDTVILGYYDPEVRPDNAGILDENAAIFDAVVTESGDSLEVHRLPLPWDESGVWFTYTNALIVNDTVLVPVYGSFKELEAEALEVYEAAAPGLEIQTVNSDKIIPSGGAIHCVTMTVPEGKLEKHQADPVELCPLNDLNKCSELLPCGGLPYEGQCVDGALVYCGGDGYPHAQECDECCAWAPEGLGGSGWYDCVEGAQCGVCADECAEGEGGCSVQGGHLWTCGGNDEDDCTERHYVACGPDLECDPSGPDCLAPEQANNCGLLPYEGRCAAPNLVEWCDDGEVKTLECTGSDCCGWNAGKGYYSCIGQCDGCVDQCEEGESGCSSKGTHSWTCELDGSGCRTRAFSSCFPFACEGGACPAGCGDITDAGVCEGDLLVWCDEEELLRDDCAAAGKACGQVPSLGGDLGCWEGCLDGCDVEGARRCADDGAAVVVCSRDSWGCLSLSTPEACGAGEECSDGVCAFPPPSPEPDADAGAYADGAAEPGPGGDCGCGTQARPTPVGSWLLLALLCLAHGLRRGLLRFGPFGRYSDLGIYDNGETN